METKKGEDETGNNEWCVKKVKSRERVSVVVTSMTGPFMVKSTAKTGNKWVRRHP